MEKALDLIEKLLDNFNLGRAVIYTLAMLFITVPLFMLASLMFAEHIQKDISAQILHDLSVAKAHIYGLLIFSYMISFTFVSAAYALFDRKYKHKALPQDSPYSAALFYSELKQAGAIQWYVSEYIRFFEAAYYVPLGMAVGTVIFFIYVMLWNYNFSWQAPFNFFLDSIKSLIVLLVVLFGVMNLWIKLVCQPIYKKCYDTLLDLIDDACCKVQTSNHSEQS